MTQFNIIMCQCRFSVRHRRVSDTRTQLIRRVYYGVLGPNLGTHIKYRHNQTNKP
jgi:hypothetical protein